MRRKSLVTGRPIATAALVAAFAFVHAGAFAADSATKTSPAKASPARPGGRLLTIAQLRDCMAQQERRDDQNATALKAKTALADEKAEIERVETALAGELAGVDRSSSDAVGAYNAKVGERNKRIEAYQASVAGYNLQADGVKATQETYVKSCGDRRYDERDLADLQRKK